MTRTVVIVTYDHRDEIAPCLTALAGERVIVVDNASPDGTADVVADAFPDVELVRRPANTGFAAAANVGIEAAAPGDVALVNPDLVADPKMLDELAAALARHPRAGIVAPVLRNVDGSVQDSARSFKTVQTLLARRTPLGSTAWGRQVLDRHLRVASGADAPIDWALGAALLVRRAAIDEVGALDERFFLYEEDVDWCARMWTAGWEVRQVAAATAVHGYHRASHRTWDLRHAPTRHHWASIARFTWKHPGMVVLGRSPRSAAAA